jgi:hypothetical protein
MLSGPRTSTFRAIALGVGALVWVVALGNRPANASGATGRLVGRVVDSHGATVREAIIVVTSAETALVRTTTAGGDGNYAVELLAPGRYVIRVSAVGFATVVLSNAIVRIGETTSLDCALSPALGAEVVTVTADAPLLRTEASHLGRVIDQAQIGGLPLPTRNYQQLLSLSPGTVTGLANNTELGRGEVTVSVNGQRTTSNNVRMNGVDANTIGGNATAAISIPAADTIEQFVVQTSLYDAARGRGAGGDVEVVTKSGSSDFHGGAYEYFRNRALNANDFFLNASGRPRPVLDRNQFGALLGGPLARERAFFFVSYQGTRERNGASFTNSLTSPTIPPGLRDDNRAPSGLSRAFGVPESEISSVSVALLNVRLPDGAYAVPSPTTPSGLTPLSSVSTFREDQYNANADLLLGARNSISVKWFSAINAAEQANSTFGGLGNGPTQLPGFGATNELRNRLLSVSHTWEVSTAAVSQARFGFNWNRAAGGPVEPFTAAQFGISSPLGSEFPGMPTISVVGLFTLGSSAFADSGSGSTTLTFADTLSLSLGRHRVRLGGEYRRSYADSMFHAYTRGLLVFPTFDAFLRGQSLSTIGSGVFDRSYRLHDAAWFVQDDVRVTERLTLNLGLRHDYYGLPVESRGRLVNFLPNALRSGTAEAPALPPNGFVQAGNAESPLPGVPFVEAGLVPADWNNFAPRLGLAWRPFATDRVVVRGGYGVYYDRVSARWALLQVLNYPYYSVATAAGRPLTDPFAQVPLPEAFPVSATVPSPLGTPINGIFVDPRFRTPYVQQFGANVQWEPARDVLLEVGYVGSRGSKLYQYVTLNQPAYVPSTGELVPPLGPSFSTQKSPGTGVQQVQTSGYSRFDSLQASVTRRFGGGIQFLASYTLGRSTDTYSGSPVNDLVAIAGDQSRPEANEGRSDYDRRHRLVASFVYDLPSPGGPEALHAALGGWRVAGIVTLQSGLPFSVVDIAGTSVIQRANFAPGATTAALDGDVGDRLDRYFDAAAFVPSRQFLAPGVPNPYFDPAAPFGDTKRNLLTGPAARNVDLSVARTLNVSEGVRLELRGELFNAFNWVNFANPNANVAVAPTFGRITATAGGPRIVQFAAKLAF